MSNESIRLYSVASKRIGELEAQLEEAKEALRDARLCIIAGETKSAKMKCEEALAKLNLK